MLTHFLFIKKIKLTYASQEEHSIFCLNCWAASYYADNIVTLVLVAKL